MSCDGDRFGLHVSCSVSLYGGGGVGGGGVGTPAGTGPLAGDPRGGAGIGALELKQCSLGCFKQVRSFLVGKKA